ncbi:hypothetical protein [Aliikangiella sp. IMCC44359]|uniref:hypothetical protein n=1 Tax=Aliikangiella sp. IMCC44359 TaxID=3459125 RepID=UPI00403AF3A2
MNIYDFVGEEMDDPIQSNNNIGDLRNLWHKVQKQRLKNRILRSTSGKMIQHTLLYYVPGLTTYCGMRGLPVITGYMSGCYLFRYRSRGELRAAHVGTHDTNKEWNDKAKDAWKSLTRQRHITDIWGFDPLKDVSMKLLMDAQKIGAPQVMGIWDGNGSARIAVMANPRGRAGKKVLVGIEAAPLRAWASIQNDPKMQ